MFLSSLAAEDAWVETPPAWTVTEQAVRSQAARILRTVLDDSGTVETSGVGIGGGTA